MDIKQNTLPQINDGAKKNHTEEKILDVNPCSDDVLVRDHIVNKMG